MAFALQENHNIPYRDPKEGTVYTSKMSREIILPDESKNTLSKHFLLRVREYGDLVAMRKKRYGIWQEYTWNEVYDHVSNFTLGLKKLGLLTQDAVIVVGENDPEMYWTQIGVHSAHGKTCCVFSDAVPNDLLYVAKTTQAKFIVAHDQEQVDKALEIKEQVPFVKKVIYWEERGLWSYDDEWLASYSEIEDIGREYCKEKPNLFEELANSTNPQDTIILSMTSGTTSLPKFAEVTHHQLVYGSAMNFNYVPTQQADNWLSFSPMAWASEQAFGFAPFLLHGMQVNFPEGPETVQTDIREIAPVGLLFPSRVWEGLARQIQFRLHDSSWLNKALFALFMPVAYKTIDLEDERKSIPPHLRFLRWLGEYAVFEPLRDKIGLTRAKNVLTAGAMLSSDVIRFFRAIGVELRQLYASTETFCTIHMPGDVRFETVGVIVPGVEIKIARDQEILVRTEARFKGYYNQPEKTGEAIDTDGWYYTGDAGYYDEKTGHLIYLERVKDLIELSNGESFSPQYIEGRLKFSQYIQDIMTIGGFDMDFVSAIVIIDFQNVSRWAEKKGISFTTFVDLSQKPEVYQLIKEDIERVNESLPEYSRVKKFVILHKEFDADEAELTRTRKLRRGALMSKYSDLLEAIYGDKRDVKVRAEVKYRDGRTGVVETALKVGDV